jgi:HSP20 family protein
MFGLLPWNPYQELLSWHRDIDDLFRRFINPSRSENEGELAATAWLPAVESFSREGHYVLRFDLPGVDPKDIDVSVRNGTLLIRGERKFVQNVQEKDYHYRETAYGKFERRMALPQGVDRDKITASYQNGVLEVSIPLPAQLAKKTIPIQTEDATRRLHAV